MSSSHTTSPRLTGSPNSNSNSPANDNANACATELRWHLTCAFLPRTGQWEAVAIEITTGMRFAWSRADRDAAIAMTRADVDAYTAMVGGAL